MAEESSRVSSGKVTPLCVNDKFEVKKVNNFDIQKSFEGSSQQALPASFEKAKKLTTPTPPSCTRCNENKSLVKMAQNLALATLGIVHAIEVPPAKIKKECIEASLQREIKGEGFSCLDGKPQAFANSSNTPCLNQKMVDYIHFALNEGINCISSVRGAPLDSRFIFKKINTETAFNFFLANLGGKGLGQLTGTLVDDVAGVMKNGKLAPGRGSYILKGIANSDNPACAPFKNIAAQDTKKAPPAPGTAANYCSWLSPGDGLARNIMYALGYYAFTYDKVITPFVKKNAPALAKNPDALNYLTLVAYGPLGTAEAFALVRTKRLKNEPNPANAIPKIIQGSSYLQDAEDRMNEMLNKRDGIFSSQGRPDYPAIEKKGATCVQ